MWLYYIGLEEPTYEAKESDKHKASGDVDCILFELKQLSKHTGNIVLDKRSNSYDLVRVAPINSSLSIALNKIHQSFILWVIMHVYKCLLFVLAIDTFLYLDGTSSSLVPLIPLVSLV